MASSTGRSPGVNTTRLSLRPVLLACALLAGAPLASPAQAEQASYSNPEAVFRAELVDRVPADLKPFYVARGWQPLWIDSSGRPRRALETLLNQVNLARVDGIKPSRLKAGELAKAMDRIDSSDPEDLARIELAADKVFTNWVKALRAAPRAPMQYESDALAPVVPSSVAALHAAASASDLDDFVGRMGWMHPLYAPLRSALLDPSYMDDPQGDWKRRSLALNLERVRALPSYPADRYVLVDAAGARLWMYEKGRPVDSMKVVVGKADNQTPVMAGFIRYAILNPYWNVPDDLVAQRIAHNVLDKGPGYLKAGGYQVMTGWDDDAKVLDPATVDWPSVASGLSQVRVRQLPGADNFMGKVKFMFPNAQGIYLHDTPQKNLMLKDERQFSSGCVRLEDAARLGRWLTGKPLPTKLRKPEQRMELPQPVPVYITYLTAFPEKSGIAFRADPYARDGIAHPEQFAAR